MRSPPSAAPCAIGDGAPRESETMGNHPAWDRTRAARKPIRAAAF
jgi:hypothetical protein